MIHVATVHMVVETALAICAIPTVHLVTIDVGGLEAVAVVVCHFGSGTRLLDRQQLSHGREASCLIAKACAERHADPGTSCPMLHSWEEEESLVHAETAQLSYAVSANRKAPIMLISQIISATGLKVRVFGHFCSTNCPNHSHHLHGLLVGSGCPLAAELQHSN